MSRRLKRIQRKFRDTTLEQLNPDGSWTQWLPFPDKPVDAKDNLVHIFDVDRFLSIYNRPVRRRQISHEPGAFMPPSGLLRNPHDGSTYIVGADRTDTDANLTIETLTTLHKVDSICTVTRRQLSDAATPEDPGWLEVVTVGQFYFDSELRTVTEESEQAGEFVGKYFSFTNCETLKPNDVVTFPNGDSFIVEMPYKDAGFNSARMANMKDPRLDITITQSSTTSGTAEPFNPYDYQNTGTSEPAAPENITAWIGTSMAEPSTESVSLNSLKVFIDEEAIGFEPSASCTLNVAGQEWSVLEVKYNFTFEQYRLDCQKV